MITAVIDINVFISALMKADTAPRALLRRCLLGQVQPLIGNALYSEYEDIMARENVFTTSALARNTVQRFCFSMPVGQYLLSVATKPSG